MTEPSGAAPREGGGDTLETLARIRAAESEWAERVARRKAERQAELERYRAEIAAVEALARAEANREAEAALAAARTKAEAEAARLRAEGEKAVADDAAAHRDEVRRRAEEVLSAVLGEFRPAADGRA